MAVNTFDITVSEVAAMIGNLGAIDATTDPTSTTVTTWLTQIASEVCAILTMIGDGMPDSVVSTAEGADLLVYHQARNAITKKLAAQWMTANRLGESDLARGYNEEYSRFVDRLERKTKTTTGSDRGVRWTHPYSASRVRDSKWSHKDSYR